MRPGIIAAMASEARILTRGPVPAGKMIFLSGGGTIFLAGLGASRASFAAWALVRNGVTALVSWGFAGGLLPGFSPGSLILPESVVAADQSIYRVDAVWHERLSNRLKPPVHLHRGILAESTVVAANGAEKRRLFRLTNASAVDMESASIARVAREAGVSFVVIRAITDPAEIEIPPVALNSIDDFGRVRLPRLLSHLATHPFELPALLRLAQNFRAARSTLTAVARQAGGTLFCP